MEINTKIDQLLGHMRSAQSLATKLTNRIAKEPGADAAGKSDFATALKSSIEQINQTQLQAQSLTQDFELGKPGVQLHDVMISMSKANVSFQQMVQVRNKLVSAYQDIMNMQV